MTFQEIVKQPNPEQPKMVEKILEMTEQIRKDHADKKAAQAIKDR